MDRIEVGLAGIGVLLILILLRFPVCVSLVAVSFGGIWTLVGLKPAWGILTAVPYDFGA